MSLVDLVTWINTLSYTQVALLYSSLVVFVSILLRVFGHRSRVANLPPGPPSDPLIGHIRYIPLSYSWFKFADWCKTYGEIVYVHVLGRPMVILGSVSVARELMEARGANYSDRPRTVLHEMMGWKNTLTFLHYGERHRRQRRLIQPHLTPQAVTDFHPIIQLFVHRYLQRIRDNPSDFRHHAHECISAVIVMATYGYEFESDADPRKLMVERVERMTNEGGNVGATLVDFIPVLRYIPAWFPGAGFKRHALKTCEYLEELFEDFFVTAKERKAAGTLPPQARPSLMYRLLDKYEEDAALDPVLREDIRNAGGVMYVAGVDTTYISVSTFFLMMTLHPEFARRAQREIDSVLGMNRLPTLEDRDDLPYVDCIIQEVFRWNPPAPLGIPHCSMEEDTYRGMTIPAKSMIVPNIWQMCRDEHYYSSPHVFNPDRFLDKRGKKEGGVVGDPRAIVFGFGRRICPGEHLATAAVWLTIACTLAAFDITRAKDVDGKEVVPEGTFLSGLTTHPAPFVCTVTPRERH